MCRILQGVLVLTMLCLPTLVLCAAEQEDRSPNIILIVADDLGYGELGCYGQRIIKTPRIDDLAKQGLRFTHFYTGSPVCAPARCVLMTGKHSGHAAIRDNRNPANLEELKVRYGWEYPGQIPLPSDELSLSELIKQRRYATGAFGKWGLGHVGTSGDPNRRGFDHFYGYLCQSHAHNHYPRFLWRNGRKEALQGNDGGATGAVFSHDLFANEALQFVRDHKNEPFFLFLPFTIPHLSIQVPSTSLSEYEGQIPEEPYEDNSRYHRHPTPRAAYAAMVSHMDRSVGAIVDLIDELNLADNTLILFTSDNGPTFDRLGGADSDFFNSSGSLRGRKGSVYEGGIRVPFIATWPGKIAPGGVTDHMAAFWDLLPTICEVVGVDAPESTDGISFTATLFGRGQQERHQFFYWEFPAYGYQQAVRAEEWKIVRHNVNKGDTKFELYNLNIDPQEKHNLAAAQPDTVQRLSKIATNSHTRSEQFPFFAAEFTTSH